VIPVAHDAGHYWPKKGFLKRPGVIKMVVGTKMDVSTLSAAELNNTLFDWMQQQMTQLEGNPPIIQDRKE
jgi:1-acyl-sn-glycerol-3-phosphate acyltransferase